MECILSILNVPKIGGSELAEQFSEKYYYFEYAESYITSHAITCIQSIGFIRGYEDALV